MLYNENDIPPEKQLMWAILRDAVYCFIEYRSVTSKTKLKVFNETKEWFFSNWKGLHSFQNICAELNLEPDYIRKGLMLSNKSRIKIQSTRVDKRENRISENKISTYRLLQSQKGKYSRKYMRRIDDNNL